MKLGQLIAALEEFPEDMEVCLQGVEGEYGSIAEGAPGRFISYRGNYAQLALESGEGYHDGFEDVGFRKNDTVGKLLEAARAAVGATFEGYKGGDYVMTEATPLWLADTGESSSIALVGVNEAPSVLGVKPLYVLLEGRDIGEYA